MHNPVLYVYYFVLYVLCCVVFYVLCCLYHVSCIHCVLCSVQLNSVNDQFALLPGLLMACVSPRAPPPGWWNTAWSLRRPCLSCVWWPRLWLHTWPLSCGQVSHPCRRDGVSEGGMDRKSDSRGRDRNGDIMGCPGGKIISAPWNSLIYALSDNSSSRVAAMLLLSVSASLHPEYEGPLMLNFRPSIRVTCVSFTAPPKKGMRSSAMQPLYLLPFYLSSQSSHLFAQFYSLQSHTLCSLSHILFILSTNPFIRHALQPETRSGIPGYAWLVSSSDAKKVIIAPKQFTFHS